MGGECYSRYALVASHLKLLTMILETTIAAKYPEAKCGSKH